MFYEKKNNKRHKRSNCSNWLKTSKGRNFNENSWTKNVTHSRNKRRQSKNIPNYVQPSVRTTYFRKIIKMFEMSIFSVIPPRVAYSGRAFQVLRFEEYDSQTITVGFVITRGSALAKILDETFSRQSHWNFLCSENLEVFGTN